MVLGILLMGAVYWSVRQSLRRRRAIAALHDTWGQPSRSSREFRRVDARDVEAEPTAGAYRLDDTTWSDLELTRVFHHLDRTLTAIGAQTLYRWIRQPLLDTAKLDTRRAFVRSMAERETRVAAQTVLLQLGDTEGWAATHAVHGELPTVRFPRWLLRLLPFALVGALAGAAMLDSLPLLVLGLALGAGIPAIHYYSDRIIGLHLGAVADLRRALGTAAQLRRALPEISRQRLGGLDAELGSLRRSLGGRPWRPTNAGMAAMSANAAIEYANAFLLRQLIGYQSACAAIAARKEAYDRVLEFVGSVDAALSVAFVRERDLGLCTGDVDASAQGIMVSNLRPPLVDAAIGNDLELTTRGLLVTGSNMGGKSTLLRATGVATVLAQSIGLVNADAYTAPPLRVASLMQVVDNPSAGVSLYRAEADHIQVLVERAADANDWLFLLDETFRGTNPLERVAASAAVLRWLARDNLVLAATHDRVLCDLLGDSFSYAFFTEAIHDGDVVFDYRLHPGVLEQTNAISLLERAGFPEQIVADARETARRLAE